MTNTQTTTGTALVAAAVGVILALSTYLALADAPEEDHEPTMDDVDDLSP